MTFPVPVQVNKAKPIPLKVLIYGDPGTGKTTFATGAAERGETLVINMEGGLLSASASPNLLEFVLSDPNLPGNNGIDRLGNILWAIAKRDLDKTPWVKGLTTLVLDSGSEFYNMALEEVVRIGITNSKGKRSDPNEVFVEDYGYVTTVLTKMFRQMRDLPYNVIMTALPKVTKPKVDGRKVEVLSVDPIDVRPYFTEKLGNSLMGFFDHVWYSYMETPDNPEATGRKYPRDMYILTRPHGVYRAKTRGTRFPEALGMVYKNPSFTGVYDLLQKTERTDTK